MVGFIKGRVQMRRLTAWLEADARRWAGPSRWWTAGLVTDAALLTLDAAFAATFGEV